MPYAAVSILDEERMKAQGDPTNISGGQGANFPTGVPGQEKGQKSSGQYANIQSYLDANKSQADGMGQKIAGDVESKAVDAQTKIQGFGSQAPSVAAYDPNSAYSKLGSLSDQEKTDYRTQRSTGGYSGPSQLNQVQGYDDAQKASSAAASSVQNIGNQAGQQVELRKTYARPNYTAGENKLDQVLLQNSQGSKQALEGVASKYAGLDKFFDSAATNVGGAVNAANTQALANKNAIQTGEQNQWKGLVDPIQARADQANTDNQGLYGRVQSDTEDDILMQETLDRLGLSSGQKLYDLNIQSYLRPDMTQVGLNNVATADERSKYQALADLVGDPTRTQIGADGKAIDPLGFDRAKFDTDLAGRDVGYNAELDKPISVGNTFEADGMKPLRYYQENLQAIKDNYARSLQKFGPNDYQTAAFRHALSIIEPALANLNNQYQNTRQISQG